MLGKWGSTGEEKRSVERAGECQDNEDVQVNGKESSEEWKKKLNEIKEESSYLVSPVGGWGLVWVAWWRWPPRCAVAEDPAGVWQSWSWFLVTLWTFSCPTASTVIQCFYYYYCYYLGVFGITVDHRKYRILPLWASTETQKFVRPHVSNFLSKCWCYCFDKHINGKICSWRSSWWKLHSESMPYDKVMTLWVRPGASGALLEKSWSFLVPGEATKPILFRVDC